MNRYVFIKPKPVFGPGLVLAFIKKNPGLTPAQITKGINAECGFAKTLPQVFVIISVLKRQGKVKAKKKGEAVVYEAS